MKRVLVTGSTGFIGSHLFNALSRHEDIEELVGTNHGIDSFFWSQIGGKQQANINLVCEDQVKSLFREFQPDTIFHFAGNPRVKEDEHHPTACTYANVVSTHNLLAHAPFKCQFVLASSATVYGPGQPFPYNEHARPFPSSSYAASKLAAEHLVEVYGRQEKIYPLILRLVANVGPGATHGLLPDVIRKLKSNSEFIELFGNEPGSIKPFIHVSDTVRATIQLVELNKRGIYNIAPQNQYNLSVLSVVELAMLKTGITKPLKWNNQLRWAGDDNFVNISGNKLYYETNVRADDSYRAVSRAVEEIAKQ